VCRFRATVGERFARWDRTKTASPETVTENRCRDQAAKTGDHDRVAHFFRELESLKSLARRGDVALVRQLAFFARTEASGKDARCQLLFIDLLEIRRLLVVRAVAPCIDAENRELRAFEDDVLQGIDESSESSDLRPLRPFDSAIYRRDLKVAGKPSCVKESADLSVPVATTEVVTYEDLIGGKRSTVPVGNFSLRLFTRVSSQRGSPTVILADRRSLL